MLACAAAPMQIVSCLRLPPMRAQRCSSVHIHSPYDVRLTGHMERLLRMMVSLWMAVS